MSKGFLDVAQTEYPTSAGPVGLPIIYRDATAVYAFFAASRRAAADRIADRGLKPALVLGGRAVIGVACYEYRDTTIGAYNEVGVAVPAVPQDGQGVPASLADLLRAPARRQLGMVVLELPVTTTLAWAAGRELWGYPKFVTPIDFAMPPGELRCTVRDPDGKGDIMTIGGALTPGVGIPPFSFWNYDRLDGRNLKTAIDVRGRSTLRLSGGVRLSVGDSTHPMAATLRALDLDGAQPLAVVTTPKVRVLLHAGVRQN